MRQPKAESAKGGLAPISLSSSEQEESINSNQTLTINLHLSRREDESEVHVLTMEPYQYNHRLEQSHIRLARCISCSPGISLTCSPLLTPSAKQRKIKCLVSRLGLRTGAVKEPILPCRGYTPSLRTSGPPLAGLFRLTTRCTCPICRYRAHWSTPYAKHRNISTTVQVQMLTRSAKQPSLPPSCRSSTHG